MQSWCPNKKALNSKLVSSERRVALLVVTGRTLCFPSRGKEGEGRREGYCQPLSPPQPTLQDQQQARPGNRFNFLDFPLALAAAAVCHTLHLETLKTFATRTANWQEVIELFARFPHSVLFLALCLPVNSLVSGKAPLQVLAFLEDCQTSKLTQFRNNIE